MEEKWKLAERIDDMLRNAPEEFVTTFMGIEVCELRRIINEYQSKGVDLYALVRARRELANLKRQLLILADVPKTPPVATVRTANGEVRATYCACNCHPSLGDPGDAAVRLYGGGSYCWRCRTNHPEELTRGCC